MGDDAAAGAVGIGADSSPERQVGLTNAIAFLEVFDKLARILSNPLIVHLHQLGEGVDLVTDGLLQVFAHLLILSQLCRQPRRVPMQALDGVLALLQQPFALSGLARNHHQRYRQHTEQQQGPQQGELPIGSIFQRFILQCLVIIFHFHIPQLALHVIIGNGIG